MQLEKTIKASAFAAAIAFFGASTQAARLGHPGVSTSAVKGAPTQWELLCDPDNATNGSITTAYSSFEFGFPLASLQEVDPQPGYAVTSVELQLANPDFSTFFLQFTPATYGAPVVINQAAFPSGVHEAGIVQVLWQQYNNDTINIQSADDAAPPGDANIYELIFNNMGGHSNAMGTFEDYLDPGMANGGVTPTPDFYSGNDDSGPFTYSADPTSPYYQPVVDTQTITVEVGTPEPSSFALGGGICALGMLRRRRGQV